MKLHPIFFMFLTGAALAQPTGAGTALGRWVTESGNLEVDIAPCAAPPVGMLCGKVVQVHANRSMGAPGQEMQPADTRPALGMTLLTALQPAGGGAYRGTIYNRENARHYSVRLAPAEPAQLMVRAYVLLPLFGKTQVWRRPAPDAALDATNRATDDAATAAAVAASGAAR